MYCQAGILLINQQPERAMKAFNYLIITLICLSGQLTASAQSQVLGGTATHIRWDAPICTRIPGMKNRITWTTAETVPTKYYEVLRSADGKNFKSIAIVAATSENTGNYMVEDENPLSLSYYQVCSVTAFGVKTYSATIKATATTGNISVRMGYNSTTLVFKSEAPRVVTLMNMNGQPLQKANTGNAQYTLNTHGLSKGIYVVKIDGEGLSELQKIMVL